MTHPSTAPAQSPALPKTNVVDIVADRVQQFVQQGALNLPAGYSAPNALKSAWLILQSTLTRDKKPVLQACTRDSIANALLDMTVQGLNPAKKQCYFIAYGDQLTCQRSYFGTMAVAKMVDPAIDEIVAEVIYDGDVCTYSIIRGKKVIAEHQQTLENVEKGVIRGAYCTIYWRDGRAVTTLMSLGDIHQAWKQSQMSPFDDKGHLKAASTHGKFTAEMAKKTVINRACKTVINASDDSSILSASLRRSDEVSVDYTVQQSIGAQANQAMIDLEMPDSLEPEAEAIPAAPPPVAANQPTLVDGPGF